MNKFYAIGTKTEKDLDGEWVTTSVVISNLPPDRLGAVNEAYRIAKQEKIKLEGVYKAVTFEKKGDILTKNMMEQKKKKRH